MLAALSTLTASARSRWIVIGAWVVLALAMVPLQGPLQSEAADESDTFMVRGSESAAAKHTIDEKFRRGSESAAVIAYFDEGGIDTPDRERINADARAICRSATIPSLTSVGTPYALACGNDRSARPEPRRPRSADVVGQHRRAVLGADDRRQHAGGRGRRGHDPLDRARAEGRRERPAQPT